MNVIDADYLQCCRPTELNGSDHIAGIFCSSGTTGLPKGIFMPTTSSTTLHTLRAFLHHSS